MLTIEYDGSEFHGWQRQPGLRTVQGVLEEALSKVCGKAIIIDGTSRTDSGVHALGQRASFKAEVGIPTDKIPFAVNNILAGGQNSIKGVGDLRIISIDEMDMDFHARFNCQKKTYRYVILNSDIPNIFRRNYCYQVKDTLDVDAMKKAAKFLVGTHDFKSFQASGGNERETTVRTISEISIEKSGDDIAIHVTGDGFLYNMVRIIVGTLVEVGKGKRRPEDIVNIIDGEDRALAGHTAPASGLYLLEIFY